MNKMRIRKVSERIVRQATPETRKRFLESLLHLLNKSPKRSTKDSWSEYYTMSRRSQNATKLNIVAKLLDRMKPQTVLDVGSNTGLFSVEAARRGARVISLDRSESCIEGLYATARRENLTITPLIADVVCPTPAFGHLGIQFPSLWKRVRSSLVLFLGIMHHVHVTGRQSFDRIIELLSAVSEDHLIFEFVGRNDAEMPHLPRSRTIDYTRDSVVGELESRFRVLKAIASDRPTRETVGMRKTVVLKFLGIISMYSVYLVVGAHVIFADDLLFRSDPYNLAVYLGANALASSVLLLVFAVPMVLVSERCQSAVYRNSSLLMAGMICSTFCLLLIKTSGIQQQFLPGPIGLMVISAMCVSPILGAFFLSETYRKEIVKRVKILGKVTDDSNRHSRANCSNVQSRRNITGI